MSGGVGGAGVSPAPTRFGKFPVYAEDNLLFYENGKLTPYKGTIPPASDPVAVIQLGTMTLPAIDKMAQTVPLEAPYDAPNATQWDSMTVETWAEQNISTLAGRQLFTLAVEAVLSVEPRDIWFLYFVFYVHAAGSVNALVANAGQGGAQDFRVSGGTQAIAVTLADQLGRRRVLLHQPVGRISQGTHGVDVHADAATVEPGGSSSRSLPTWPAGSSTSRLCRPRVTSSRSGSRSAR